MEKATERILEASIYFEEKVSQFYTLLSRLMKDDALFWEELASEEENHSSIIGSLRDFNYDNSVFFPVEALSPSLEDIVAATNQVDSLIDRYMLAAPDREEAFLESIKIENSSGEYYFQLAAISKEQTKALKVFQQMVGSEKDHAKRIQDKMKREFAAD